MIFIFANMKTRREKNRTLAAAALGKHQSVFVAGADGMGSESQNGLQCTAARRSSLWWFRTTNQRQRNAARHILEWIGLCCASVSPVVRSAPVCLPSARITQPVQWGQASQHPGQEHRARARPRAHLGDLGSASAPMVSRGKINHHILSARK